MEAADGTPGAPTPCWVTLGHGARSGSALVGHLTAAWVGTVVDVRSYPGSRRHPQFARQALAATLADAGIDYVWAGRALGGRRRAAADAVSRHPALASKAGLAAFADHMTSDRFRDTVAELALRARGDRLALLCAESEPRTCHRWLIADYLSLVMDSAVSHLATPRAEIERHAPSPAARRLEGELRYDRGFVGELRL